MDFWGRVKKIIGRLVCEDQVGINKTESTENNAITPTILDVYVKEAPSPEAAFKIFEGQWSSCIPGFGLGAALLFDDFRIKWLEEQSGGLKGKRILELGPLEGGHTYMLSKAGASSITSIESNTTAFLKCLIVQNALKFDAEFMLGDFCAYLDTCKDKFDLLLASGVLYHMTDPVKLLQDMAKVSNAIGIWTHYYDPDVILGREDLTKKFESEPEMQQVGDRKVVLYKQSYLEALNWGGFCGGSAPTSYWLTRDSLIGLLEDLGFKVLIGDETKVHPNGSAILLFASR
jgi:SAM-dependent methyltransferase